MSSAELRDIARTLEDYSDGFNSMALHELAERVEAVADAMEAEETAAARFVAEREAGGVEPPPCPEHREVQHRDKRPPWCNRCGWRHAVPAQPAVQIRERK